MIFSSDYDVKSFSTLSEFTKRDANIDPDLYIFDVKLPDGSEIDLCADIKNNNHGKDLPVIMMSANAKN
ncbi:response regulator [Chryseobacterium soldanellicola]|uniref:response regulator n=1 Tax=Chryseobacterium soldanellicola TaxID=311333 RepID=UPI000B7F8F52